MPTMRLRFTVRGMMSAVAVVAALIGAGIGLSRRRERFLARAALHGVEIGPAATVHYSFNDDRAMRWRTWHARLVEKYERAARHPWLPVAPDPPEPK